MDMQISKGAIPGDRTVDRYVTAIERKGWTQQIVPLSGTLCRIHFRL